MCVCLSARGNATTFDPVVGFAQNFLEKILEMPEFEPEVAGTGSSYVN